MHLTPASLLLLCAGVIHGSVVYTGSGSKEKRTVIIVVSGVVKRMNVSVVVKNEYVSEAYDGKKAWCASNDVVMCASDTNARTTK